MAFGLALEVLITVGVIVIALAVSLLVSRGRMLKCPDCGTVFSAPTIDQRRFGAGWTLPYLGKVKCPKCGESRSRRNYQKAPPASQPPT